MRFIDKCAISAAACVSLVGTSLVTAAPAHAGPVGCSAIVLPDTPDFTGGSGVSTCAGGSGSHRVKVSCDRRYTTDVIRYGPWVGTSKESFAPCAGNETPRVAWVQTQGD
ncbi:hypothetical protein Skr01_75770 [Sphaerisporangium krabiense]|uniref:Secreted protein n=1 Tax=Sphaerisporangium krabiense TaxID=763782 RepID=A0A7W8ZA40_9ACTN|nr:hypothetical protein [Sphaerisporangium krabiense]MBB5630198.1 hypothetical protein [Sphaerisporangium krabiense]GII67492.1 hypothetical protein Skr01_75770 [Sphaerisporangium krabiense]